MLSHLLHRSLSFFADKCATILQLKQVHAQMIVSSRIHDNFAASRLLSFCSLSDRGDLLYALKLFENIQDPNVFMWNTVIRGLSSSSSSGEAEAVRLYAKMRRVGSVPNEYTFPFVLKAVCRCRSLEYCQQVHSHVLKFGLIFNLHVVNGLVRGYLVCGDQAGARRVFDEFPHRDLNLWTTLICGHAQNADANEALLLFNQFSEAGFEPNGATLASVLSACAGSGCLEFGERIHSFIEEKGIEIGTILGTALVHMYVKNGSIPKARRLFDSMLEKNVATWNALICGLASHGHAEEALYLFRRVEQGEVVPNDITFVGVLSACRHAGLIGAGQAIFYSMKRVYGVEPKIQHYGCMVDLLGRGGKIVEAEGLMKGMPCKADDVMLGSLLAACQTHANIEVAERVANEILNLDPSNHGVYVVLSNMYAESGRWDDVLRLRRVMKRQKLKKAPGWSRADGDD